VADPGRRTRGAARRDHDHAERGGVVLSVIALLLGVLTLVRDVRLLRDRWSAYDFSVIAAPFPCDEVPVPASYPGAAYLHVPNRGTALVSDLIDRALWKHNFPVEFDEEPYRLPPKLRATHDAVRIGMERELCEETGLRPNELGSTHLVGFARWMERGARPEFFGLSRLSVDSDQVRRRRSSGAERLYGSPPLLVKTDIAELGNELRHGEELLTAPSLPAKLRDDGSLPLLLALRTAAVWTVSGNKLA
jgi:hypothetical protein